MDTLEVLWGASLIIMITALPMGLVRLVAYRSGETDHTQTMLIALLVALGTGLLGLVGLVITSVLLIM
jgi:hypothetical protein